MVPPPTTTSTHCAAVVLFSAMTKFGLLWKYFPQNLCKKYPFAASLFQMLEREREKEGDAEKYNPIKRERRPTGFQFMYRTPNFNWAQETTYVVWYYQLFVLALLNGTINQKSWCTSSSTFGKWLKITNQLNQLWIILIFYWMFRKMLLFWCSNFANS